MDAGDAGAGGTPAPRDHGGNLAAAVARHGGAPGEWLDLSTGINPCPYPVPPLPPEAWSCLPDSAAMERLLDAARRAYDVPPGAEIVAAAGASALIRLMPRLARGVSVAIPGPTYNEHAAAFAAEGWEIAERPGPATGAAVIVNPNNPDGRVWERHELKLLAEALPLMVVDESFADADPHRSMVPEAGGEGLVVLKSFGKFYGLAGLRLGFAICGPRMAARLRELLGPWAVSGPALEAGAAALSDSAWAEETRARLAADTARLAEIGTVAGWRLVGSVPLFATFETPDAAAAQARLASARIWSRIFPYSATWLRLGLPGSPDGWRRLASALGA